MVEVQRICDAVTCYDANKYGDTRGRRLMEDENRTCLTIYFTITTALEGNVTANATNITSLLRRYEYIFARAVDDQPGGGALALGNTSTLASNTTCFARILLEPVQPPLKIECSCPEPAAPDMNAALLSTFFRAIGILPTPLASSQVEQCDALLQRTGTCTYDLLSLALRNGVISPADFGFPYNDTSTAIGSSHQTSPMPPMEPGLAEQMCEVAAARACFCPACVVATPASVVLSMLTNNVVDLRFSEPVVTVSGAPLSMSDLLVDVQGWQHDLSVSRQETALTAHDHSTSRLELSLAPPPLGIEKLLVRSARAGLVIFGAKGGALVTNSQQRQIDSVLELIDMTPPTFVASSVAEGNRISNITESTILIEFSEPCFGSGALATIVGDDWQLSVEGGLATATAVVRQSWLEYFEPGTANASTFSAGNISSAGSRRMQDIVDLNPNLGTESLTLDIRLVTSATGAISYVPGSTALVYFIGPRPKSVGDRAGNFLIGSASGGALPAFRMVLPPPRPDGLTSRPSGTSGMLTALIISMLMILFYMLLKLRKYRWVQKDCHLLSHDVGKLEQLLDVLGEEHERQSGHLAGTDKLANELLARAVNLAAEEDRSLPECVREVFQSHIAGLHVPLWQRVLLGTAYAAYCERHLSAASSDREALEVLLAWLHDAARQSLQEGYHGGGGIRVTPARLAGLPHSGGYVLYDESALPECVLRGAKTLGDESQGSLETLQEQLTEMQRLLEEKSVLPAAVSASLIAVSLMRRSSGTTPTECQQIELLGTLLRCNTSAAKPVEADGGGIRVIPPKLTPAPSAFEAIGDEDQNTGEEEIDAERITETQHVEADGGGIRVTPPKLTPAPYAFEAIGDEDQSSGEGRHEEEVDDERITETRWLKPGPDGKGGVRIAPPRLSLPSRSHAIDGLIDEEEDLMSAHEDSELSAVTPPTEELVEMISSLEYVELQNDDFGGGARCPPPKLLPFVPPPAPLLFEEASDVLDHRPLDNASSVQANMQSGDGARAEAGGGVRAAPPKLLPVVKAEPARPLQQDTWNFSQHPRLTHGLSFRLDDELDVVSEHEDLPSTEDDAIQPSDHLVMLDTEMESAEMLPEGGGARVFPPRLLPFRESPAPELFEHSLSAHTSMMDERSLVGNDQFLAGDAELSNSTIIERGGGARVYPPKLLPVALALATAASELCADDGISMARRRDDTAMRRRKQLQSNFNAVVLKRRSYMAFQHGRTLRRLYPSNKSSALQQGGSVRNLLGWRSPDRGSKPKLVRPSSPFDKITSTRSPQFKAKTAKSEDARSGMNRSDGTNVTASTLGQSPKKGFFSRMSPPKRRQKFRASAKKLQLEVGAVKALDTSFEVSADVASPPPSPPAYDSTDEALVDIPWPVVSALRAECRRLNRPDTNEDVIAFAFELKDDYERAMHREGCWGVKLDVARGRNASSMLDSMSAGSKQRADLLMEPEAFEELKLSHTWKALTLAVDSFETGLDVAAMSGKSREEQQKLVEEQLAEAKADLDESTGSLRMCDHVCLALLSPWRKEKVTPVVVVTPVRSRVRAAARHGTD